MNIRIVTLVGVALALAGPALASDESDVRLVVHQWVENFTKVGIDPALCTEQTSIVDDFAPFIWHGPGACSKWHNDYQALLKTAQLSDASFTLLKPEQLQVSGIHAYFVSRAKLSFREKGRLMKQIASETLVLEKTTAGWRVIGEAWAADSEAVAAGQSASTAK